MGSSWRSPVSQPEETILEQHIAVERLGSGWAAVHRVLVKEGDHEPYWDVEQTGSGRFRFKESAEAEARAWANAEQIPLRL